ncbi:MAG: phospholipase [Pseudonocardia sp.]|nr:phospholipase [Pseudonocardia sp.]
MVVAVVAVAVVAVVPAVAQRSVLGQLTDGRLEGADYWTDTPEILSAGFGFDGIIGLSTLDEETVRAAGGTWYGSLTCAGGEEPGIAQRTSAVATEGIGGGFVIADGAEIAGVDGTPVVFSWPVATDTVDPTDFRFTLNTGEVRVPDAAGMLPNWELNERNTVVMFGDLGNRGTSADPDGVHPVRLDIVDDGTPLTLVGPQGDVSAVGLSWATDRTSYDAGPVLVGAKLNHVDEQPRGEAGVPRITEDAMPNDEGALYDEGDFRLRMLTSGGFSPNGVSGVRPDQFEEFFRIHATGPDGATVLIEEVGRTYEVAGGGLRVVGLSDLGRVTDPGGGVVYDDCYAEDRDNYLDVIIVGDEAAARSITDLEIPALPGGYSPFYNPGGPGPEPFPGVTYSAPGPPDVEPVVIALDDPMRVDR